jgi:hypothetical protein
MATCAMTTSGWFQTASALTKPNIKLCGQHQSMHFVLEAKQLLPNSQRGEPGPGVMGPTGVMPGGSKISKVLLPPGDVTLPGFPLQFRAPHMTIAGHVSKRTCRACGEHESVPSKKYRGQAGRLLAEDETLSQFGGIACTHLQLDGQVQRGVDGACWWGQDQVEGPVNSTLHTHNETEQSTHTAQHLKAKVLY